jgi:uncharacterized membrane protein YdjX (TVP38/TMEM64 family)
MSVARAGRGVLARGLLVIILLVGGVALWKVSGSAYGPEQLKAWVDAELRGAGVAAVPMLIGAGAVFTGLGLSRQVFAMVAGYAYGAIGGTAIALTAEMLGVALAFAFARHVARDPLRRRFGGRIRRFDEFLTRHPVSMTVAAKLFPLGSNLVLNLLAGVSSIALWPYLLGSAIGHLPQTAVFATVAAGLSTGRDLQILLGTALFAASGLIGLRLMQKYRRLADAAVAPATPGDRP